VSSLKKLLPLLILALAAWLALGDPQPTGPAPDPTTPSGGRASVDAAGNSSSPVIADVVVRDRDGRIAWRGDMDLGPSIARIERGERDRHRNDGAVFQNREGRLPKRPSGYYREFVVRTPGLGSVGPQRLVVGRDGDAWYTSDHYRSFTRLNIEVRAP
jgi:filamentous hemagglutinin